jgi:hypothetical protein
MYGARSGDNYFTLQKPQHDPILQPTIEGLEARKPHIDEVIAELRQRIVGGSSAPASVVFTNRPPYDEPRRAETDRRSATQELGCSEEQQAPPARKRGGASSQKAATGPARIVVIPTAAIYRSLR